MRQVAGVGGEGTKGKEVDKGRKVRRKEGMSVEVESETDGELSAAVQTCFIQDVLRRD